MLTVKNNRAKEQGSVIKCLLLSILIGCVVFLILLSIAAIAVTFSNVGLEQLKYLLYIILPLSVFASALFNGYKTRQLKGILSGIISAALTVLLLGGVILIANRANIDTSSLFIFPLSMIIGIPAGILGANLR